MMCLIVLQTSIGFWRSGWQVQGVSWPLSGQEVEVAGYKS